MFAYQNTTHTAKAGWKEFPSGCATHIELSGNLCFFVMVSLNAKFHWSLLGSHLLSFLVYTKFSRASFITVVSKLFQSFRPHLHCTGTVLIHCKVFTVAERLHCSRKKIILEIEGTKVLRISRNSVNGQLICCTFLRFPTLCWYSVNGVLLFITNFKM